MYKVDYFSGFLMIFLIVEEIKLYTNYKLILIINYQY